MTEETDIIEDLDEEIDEEEVGESDQDDTGPDLEGDNAALIAILQHVAPDLDIEAALSDDVAWKRDGTVVYVPPAGASADSGGDDQGTPSPRARRRLRPAETRRHTSKGKPDVMAMVEAARKTNSGGR